LGCKVITFVTKITNEFKYEFVVSSKGYFLYRIRNLMKKVVFVYFTNRSNKNLQGGMQKSYKHHAITFLTELEQGLSES